MLDATKKCCWNSSFGLKGELLIGGNTYRIGNTKYGKSFKYLSSKMTDTNFKANTMSYFFLRRQTSVQETLKLRHIIRHM